MIAHDRITPKQILQGSNRKSPSPDLEPAADCVVDSVSAPFMLFDHGNMG